MLFYPNCEFSFVSAGARCVIWADHFDVVGPRIGLRKPSLGDYFSSEPCLNSCAPKKVFSDGIRRLLVGMGLKGVDLLLHRLKWLETVVG